MIRAAGIALSIVLAAGFAVLGMMALLASFLVNFHDDTAERKIAALESQNDRLQGLIDEAILKQNLNQKELQSLQENNNRSEQIQAKRLELAKLDRMNSPVRQNRPAVAAPIEKPQTFSDFSNFYKRMTTTLVSGGAGAASASLVKVGEQCLLVSCAGSRGMEGFKRDIASFSVRYTDGATGLVFVDARGMFTPDVLKAAAELEPFASPKIGESIYSYYKNGADSRNGSMVDGNISSEPRTLGKLRMSQTTLPNNSGMRGALVFNSAGMRVGIFAGDSESLDRTSFIIPGDEVAAAVKRCATAIGSGNVLSATEPAAKREIPNALYELDAESPALHQRGFFPGPDKKIILWDVQRKRIAAYDMKAKEPVWESDQPRRFDVCWHAQGTTAIVVRADQKGCELDLRSGAVKRDLSESFMQLPVHYSPYGPEYLVYTYRAFWFADPRSGAETAAAPLCILGHSGNTYYYADRAGLLGKFDSEAVRRILIKTEEVRKSIVAPGRINVHGIVNTLNERYVEMKEALVSFGVTISAPSSQTEMMCHVIPGDDTHKDRIVVGQDLYEVFPDGLKRQKALQTWDHSCARQDWFIKYKGQLDLSLPRITAISPDMKYAATFTHLIDLNTMQPAGELPFPGANNFFLSDSEHVCMFDPERRKLVVFSLKQLLAKKP